MGSEALDIQFELSITEVLRKEVQLIIGPIESCMTKPNAFPAK